jgi:hypothetical protein
MSFPSDAAPAPWSWATEELRAAGVPRPRHDARVLLGDDQHRDVVPDPTDLRQHLDARVVLCEPVDLLCQPSISEQVAQPARRDIRLGQQVGAQQMGQRARVDRVGLDPRRGDRLGPQWVREVAR